MSTDHSSDEFLAWYFGDDNKPEPPPRPPHLRIAGDAPSAIRYAAAAFAAELDNVRSATEGTRNHALNTAAYLMGTFIAVGTLDENMVTAALRSAAFDAGLTTTETEATIRSGIKAGLAHPRDIPAPTVPLAPLIAPWTPPEAAQQGADAEVDIDTEAAEHLAFLDRRQAWVTEHLPVTDWAALWADDSDEDWIIEPLLPARRLVALYSAPKVGKSLLMLELAAVIAAGGMLNGKPKAVLGVVPERAYPVLYVDFENDPRGDVRPRLQAMGFAPESLTNLHHLAFPTLAALDSEQGSVELMAAVAVYGAEVVIIDTVSRAVAGDENENDTWLAFYRHSGLKLKQQGISLIRLDHSGKDETKGQRGGSAKSGDVDAIWRLSKVDDAGTTFRLDCEGARIPIAEKAIVFTRLPLPHLHSKVEASGVIAASRAKVDEIVAALDSLGAPNAMGRDAARDLLKPTGLTGFGKNVSTSPLPRAVAQRHDRVSTWTPTSTLED